jgi:hypothetical protein
MRRRKLRPSSIDNGAKNRKTNRRLLRMAAQGEGEMTDQPTTTSRFVLRKGAAEGKWMIWDRERRGPAWLERGLGLACELSEEQARKLLEHLTRTNSGK